MIDPAVVFAAFCLYVGILFSIALWAERRAERGKNIANNAVVYSLSLAVYCTAWTYYGSVGKAATSGMLFLPIYLGPTLCILAWWIVLRKLVRLKAAHRITSIADFISARYNKSQLLAAIVTIIAIVGILPYVSLQLKSNISTFLMITSPSADDIAAAGSGGFWIRRYVGPVNVLLMIGFAIILGVRRLDPTERHEGMVAALAAECLVKLVAFLMAGIFVTYFVFNGFTDIFQRISGTKYQSLISTWRMGSSPYFTWTSYLLLSMSAILFLPRQFHVAVVENSDEKHIPTAMWLFPLYMLLINVFVLPIAMGGLIKGYPLEGADTYVLMLPLHHGKEWLSLLVFIGGVSAGAGMIMVASVTIATMITNHLLLPVVTWIKSLGFLKGHLLQCRWVAVAAFLITGYWLEEHIMKPYMLVSIGLISFAAVLQFAPVILGGLFWRKGNTVGAMLGLTSGFAVWCYTQLFPSCVRNGWLSYDLLEKGPFGIKFLKPEALFGLSGLDSISHTVFWSMLFNVGFYVLGSLCFAQSPEEESIAEQFVTVLESEARRPRVRRGEAYIELSKKTRELEGLLCQYFPRQKADEMLDRCLDEVGIRAEPRISIIQLVELHSEVEKSLAGAIGAAAAHKAIRETTIFTPRESRELSDAYAEILAGLKLSPAELKARIDYYQDRESFLMRHVDELESEITERMRIQRALEESENRFRGLVETMNEGLAVEDEHGTITYVNERICDLWDRSRVEIVGRSALEFLNDVPQTASAEQSGASDPADAAPYEAIWKRKDGRRIWTVVSPVSIFDGQGNKRGKFSVITDISLIKTHEREKANLISMFAHDMRSSLAGIHGLGHRLATKFCSLDDDTREEYLRIINKEASKLEVLVEDFLEFSRLETGGLEMHFEELSIETELKELFDVYRSRAIQKGIELRLDIEEALPFIEADATRLRRVFTNLLDNAIKFSKETGVVTIAAAADGPDLVVKIMDEGIGIDPEEVPFVFDIFHRARTGEKREGYGIGLATVKAIVEAHRGRVTVESQPGKGSVFTVSLPGARRECESS
jgi:PAS domain S-box-containing protein